MHDTQLKILTLLDNKKKIPLSLRGIGREIEELHPQNVKHHLETLEELGFLIIDRLNREVVKILDMSYVERALHTQAAYYKTKYEETLSKIQKLKNPNQE